MGKKKRGHPDVEEILARPWCYYCERDFEDLKLLISHQKAKHFKCERCGRRLNTAGGLAVHMNQVHKESLDQVENALPNRNGLEIEIFGMEGVPEDIISQHRARIVQNFYEAQEERRAATGNPPPGQSGGQGGHASKKAKVETVDEMKKRLAEHKARMALQKGSINTSAAAAAGRDTESPGHAASPGAFFPGAPTYGQPGYPSHQFPPGYAANLPARPPSGAPPPLPGAVQQNLPQRPGGGFPFPPPGLSGAAPGVPSTLDDLVSGAATQGSGGGAADAGAEPKAKKDKSTRMMVSGAEFSLEEMMVQWSSNRPVATSA